MHQNRKFMYLKNKSNEIRQIPLLLCLLPVVGVLSVFSQIMTIQQVLLHGSFHAQRLIHHRHARHFFQYNGIVYGVVGVGAPNKRTVRVNQSGRNGIGISNRFDDYLARLRLIFAALTVSVISCAVLAVTLYTKG